MNKQYFDELEDLIKTNGMPDWYQPIGFVDFFAYTKKGYGFLLFNKKEVANIDKYTNNLATLFINRCKEYLEQFKGSYYNIRMISEIVAYIESEYKTMKDTLLICGTELNTDTTSGMDYFNEKKIDYKKFLVNRYLQFNKDTKKDLTDMMHNYINSSMTTDKLSDILKKCGLPNKYISFGYVDVLFYKKRGLVVTIVDDSVEEELDLNGMKYYAEFINYIRNTHNKLYDGIMTDTHLKNISNGIKSYYKNLVDNKKLKPYLTAHESLMTKYMNNYQKSMNDFKKQVTEKEKISGITNSKVPYHIITTTCDHIEYCPYDTIEIDLKYKLVRIKVKKTNDWRVILNLNSKDAFVSQLGNMTKLLYPYNMLTGYIITKLLMYCEKYPELKDILPEAFWKGNMI